ncbi:hypothetical protein ICJ04_12915 [Stenotrophomonas sp. 169]|uniref:hypothetical protein n=1 Tax=Stenotrophomonas sp. 169 TaxID=2770322 RepID=UPI0016626579|nr:hypothetical protein [Stenotrophomonas sp. 169]QNR96417.1 hypothetical protein ICJ04_12915 [Stenotrophomonas sp. 169]
MGEFSPPGARLHALIGDAVLDIPRHLAERLETTLKAQGMGDPTPALMAHLTLAKVRTVRCGKRKAWGWGAAVIWRWPVAACRGCTASCRFCTLPI